MQLLVPGGREAPVCVARAQHAAHRRERLAQHFEGLQMTLYAVDVDVTPGMGAGSGSSLVMKIVTSVTPSAAAASNSAARRSRIVSTPDGSK